LEKCGQNYIFKSLLSEIIPPSFLNFSIQAMQTLDIKDVTIRFAGDSGDGIQLAGSQFAYASATAGNFAVTLADFPAEIRAPQGTIGGVSGFQIHFGDDAEARSPGDEYTALVAMNAAALKANIALLQVGGTLIVNSAGFDEKNLRLAGYASNPLEDGSLSKFQVFAVDMRKLAANALQGMDLPNKIIDQTKNFFALGLTYWLYSRPPEKTLEWIREKFADKPDRAQANVRAFIAGWNYGENSELFPTRFAVSPASLPAGRYRTITGNAALALGLVAAAHKTRLELFLGSYPITPASDILHMLAGLKHFRVTTFQAEDEIAAVASAIGASYGGALAATSTSGPGMALKAEALGLAVMAELPLVVVNVQRAGPSTGMPTKTEQADLFQALYGRSGEAPLPVLAPASPAECFSLAFEAARIALEYMTPVVLLSDAFLANSAETWRVPETDALPEIHAPIPRARKERQENENNEENKENGKSEENDHAAFLPYRRDETTLARAWAIPGMRGLEHRIGGLEKENLTGNVSHEARNHETMTRLRAEKIRRVAQSLPPAQLEPIGDASAQVLKNGAPEIDNGILLIGWGSSFGALAAAAAELRRRGLPARHLHLRSLHPLQNGVESIMRSFRHIFVAELNSGQLHSVLQAAFCLPSRRISKVQGQPFTAREIVEAVTTAVGEVELNSKPVG
jgi:2-oxoglutarate ferredoxin oxidoreductase subunit alpha